MLPSSAPEAVPVSVAEHRDLWVGEDIFTHIDDYSTKQNREAWSQLNKEGLGSIRSMGAKAEKLYRQIEAPYQMALDYLGQNIDIYG